MTDLISFYKGKTVLITGHTGFKGSWLCRILTLAGAKVVGYALNPPTNPSLFETLDLDKEIVSVIADVRDQKGTLGQLLYNKSLYNHLDATVLSADSLLTDLKAHPKRYVHFSVFGKKDK